jgi:hypothetical protein
MRKKGPETETKITIEFELIFTINLNMIKTLMEMGVHYLLLRRSSFLLGCSLFAFEKEFFSLGCSLFAFEKEFFSFRVFIICF